MTDQPITPADEQVIEPCPFCGGAADTGEAENHFGDLLPTIYCKACNAQVVATDEDEAFAKWHTRLSPVVDGLAAELEALGSPVSGGGRAYSFDDAQKLIDLLPRILTALSLRPAPETTASDDVVESVARAICLEDGRAGDTNAVEQLRVDIDWRGYVPAARAAITAFANLPKPTEDFQTGVDRWMDACFGEAIKADKVERADRFCEEALELCQTMPGFTKDRAHALVDYVFDRPQGEINQEVGGVMVTLAALCNTTGVRIDEAAANELARVWTKVEQIRAKQASKPTGSALPVPKPTEQATSPATDAVLRAVMAVKEAVLSFTTIGEHNRQGAADIVADAVLQAFDHPQAGIASIDAALASSKPTGEGEDVVERERETIAKWLRQADPWHGLHPHTANAVANWIERGDHAAAIRSGDKAEGEAS